MGPNHLAVTQLSGSADDHFPSFVTLCVRNVHSPNCNQPGRPPHVMGGLLLSMIMMHIHPFLSFGLMSVTKV